MSEFIMPGIYKAKKNAGFSPRFPVINCMVFYVY